MNDPVLNLKPEKLWYYFNEITKIPRPSKSEEKIAAYIVNFGESHHLETLTDDIGNILIRKSATAGKENSRMVVLQSHIDMVCEKNNDVVHDFETDPIKTWIDGEWLKAKGTTLGADDGIGVAAQLAFLDDNSIEHGPVECLFTVDEETGLTGANELNPGFLKSKILLNLDSEDEGEIFIGCAGGRGTMAYYPYQSAVVPSHHTAFRIDVRGLQGGHSGDDIHRGLGNANKILVRLLYSLHSSMNIAVSYMDGGKKHNAIPREAFAIFTVSSIKSSDILDQVKLFDSIIKSELKTVEKNVEITCEPAEIPAVILNPNIQSKLLKSLYACPNGVIRMSDDLEDLVETSTNLASIKTNVDQIIAVSSQRSSVASGLDDICNMIKCTFLLGGAKVEQGDGYPGWNPNVNSEILGIAKQAYTRLFHIDPKVKAIHAGLECGLIGEKYPDMDMISFGPTVKGVHSPDERLHIESVSKFWELLIEIMKSI